MPRNSSDDESPRNARATDDAGAFNAQRRVIAGVARHIPELGKDFSETAMAYASRRHQVFRDLVEHGPERLRFQIHRSHVLQQLHTREGGAVVVLAHTGYWFAVPFAIQSLGVPFTFVVETLHDGLLDRYAAAGVRPIVAMGGVTLHLRHGRRIRIPGASPMEQARENLQHGLTVGFLGDTPHGSGKPVEILGRRRRLIHHYALLAVREARTLVVLRQWTEDGVVRIRFDAIRPPSRLTRRSEQVHRLVERFAEVFDRDLRARPHQYAFFPEGVFGGLAEPPG